MNSVAVIPELVKCNFYIVDCMNFTIELGVEIVSDAHFEIYSFLGKVE